MKIQLIILGLFVVAALANPHRDENDENQNQVGRRRHFRGRRRNDNQIAANAEDAELEDSLSAETDVTERTQRRKCGSGRWHGERRGNRRHQFRHDPEFHQRNGAEGEEFHHNAEWHQKHGVPMPGEKADVDRKHHKHHHHHHHHHKNHTTTTPATTTIPSEPITE